MIVQHRGSAPGGLRERDAIVGLKVEGLRELQDQLIEMVGTVGAVKALAKAGRKALLPVLMEAKARVPVDTGLLRDSLKITVKKAPKNSEAAVVVGIKVAVGKGGGKSDLKKLSGAERKRAWRKSAHWRWHFIEFGTSKMAAKPFLRPSFDRNAQRMVDMLRAELAKEIARVLRKRASPQRKAA